MAIFSKEKLDEIKKKEKEHSVKRHTIMLVDDEEGNLSSMASLLNADYNIITAHDGRKALNIILEMEEPAKLSLIISDQRMPNLTGIQLFEELKKKIPNTIRILITGFIDVPVIIDSINRAKIHELILKPFDPEEFLIRVKHAVLEYDSLEKKNDKKKQEIEELKKKVEQLETIIYTDK